MTDSANNLWLIQPKLELDVVTISLSLSFLFLQYHNGFNTNSNQCNTEIGREFYHPVKGQVGTKRLTENAIEHDILFHSQD